MNMPDIIYRKTLSTDFKECIEVRSQTRQNPSSEAQLAAYGITAETQGPLFDDGTIVGFVAESDSKIVGFCSGNTTTGEVLVLALLPAFENSGIGKQLLQRVVTLLFEFDFEKLWLAASPDPDIRAHGFYRHLGWRYTGQEDAIGDEILELGRT